MQWVAALLPIALAISASSSKPQYDEAKELAKLQAAQVKWTAHNISSYSYTRAVSCFCFGDGVIPLRVTVENDQVTHLTYTRPGDKVQAGEEVAHDSLEWQQPLTVPAVFESILRLLTERHTARLQIEYDPELGYVRALSTDPNIEIADDEGTIKTSDFEVN